MMISVDGLAFTLAFPNNYRPMTKRSLGQLDSAFSKRNWRISTAHF